MNELSVSVIIPVYNRENTILRAIQSVSNQTFQDLEIVLVDDGSSDNTIEVIRTIKDSRCQLIQHGINRGAAAARNTGIKKARGKYIAFLDSDDEWFPEKLERQISALKRAKKNEKACCTGLFLNWADSKSILEKIPKIETNWLKQLLLGCDLSPGSTLLVERSCFDHVGFLDESLSRLEDWEWLLRYAMIYQMMLVKHPLATIYRGDNADALAVERAEHLILEKHAELFRSFGRRYQHLTIARRWFQIAEVYYRERRLIQGTHYFLKGFCRYPFQPLGLYLLLFDALFRTNLAKMIVQHKQQLRNDQK